MKCKSARVVAPTAATPHFVEQPVWVMSAVFAISATSPVYLRLRKDCGIAARLPSNDAPSTCAPAAGAGWRASLEDRARRPLAAHASTSKVAASPPRQRTSSSRHQARPTPGTGRGVEGSALMRQHVVAAVGCPKSATSAWRRQRRTARPITSEPSAASCCLGEALMDRRETSATTAPSLRCKRRSRLLSASAAGTLDPAFHKILCPCPLVRGRLLPGSGVLLRNPALLWSSYVPSED
jgi:hypothetical protein